MWARKWKMGWVGELRSDCIWLICSLEKVKHCPIDSGKLIKCFKQRDALFKIVLPEVRLVPLGEEERFEAEIIVGKNTLELSFNKPRKKKAMLHGLWNQCA